MEQTTVINSVVGEGTFYNGTIDAVDILRIDGSFVGTARSRDVILIGMQGKIKGILSSPRIIIAGMVDCTIQDTSLVILQYTSVVLGLIEAKNIIIESNALVSATLRSTHIGREEAPQEKNTESSPVQYMRPEIRMVERFSQKTLARLFSE